MKGPSFWRGPFFYGLFPDVTEVYIKFDIDNFIFYTSRR